MSRTYGYRKCYNCNRQISSAGVAFYNHMAAHYRRIFRTTSAPRTIERIERILASRRANK